MKHYRNLLTAFLFIIGLSAFAQQGTIVKGKLQDKANKSALLGATIVFTNAQDTLQRIGTVTGLKGDFSINLFPGRYRLSVSFVGYQNFQKQVEVGDNTLDLKMIQLAPSRTMLKEVKVVDNSVSAIQKGDTTIFNPSAYKVNSDASSEALLSKMHGVHQIDGKLQVNGEEVKEVLVDGKKFFANDVAKALKTIPADVVKQVKVYKHESDKSKMTGVEDKETGKTVNIVTKAEGKDLYFGEVAAGLGKEQKYGVDGSVNRFTKSNRLTVSGRTSNINAPLRIRNNSGDRIAITGNDMKNKELDVNFNLLGNTELAVFYLFSENTTDNLQVSNREYFVEPSEGQVNNDSTRSFNTNRKHDAHFYWNRIRREKHQLLVNAYASVLDNSSKSSTNSLVSQNGEFVNLSKNENRTDGFSQNLNTNVSYSYRFDKKGRALSVGFHSQLQNANNNRYQESEVLDKNKKVVNSLNKLIKNNSEKVIYSGDVTFNEKMGKYFDLTTNYNLDRSVELSKIKTYEKAAARNEYSKLDALNSNTFRNTSINNKMSMKVGFSKEKIKFSFGTNLLLTKLASKETFPDENNFSKNFKAIQPMARFSYTREKGGRINLHYRSYTRNPSLGDLQEIVDISDPSYLSSGNANLKPSQSHNVSLSYWKSNPKKSTMMMLSVRATLQNNLVARNRIIANQDTLIRNAYFLPKGGQFSVPINIDGNVQLSARFSYGMPIKLLRLNLNTSSMVRYGKKPTIINGQESVSNQVRLGHSLKLSSNISEKIDFTINCNSHYSIVEGSGAISQTNYFTQNTNFGFYWNFFKNLILRTSVNQSYSGANRQIEANSRWYLNVSMSSKLFKSKKGEISLVFYDLLHQENERVRTINDLFVSETYSPQLNKFFMLSFSYKIRNRESQSTSNPFRY